MANIVPGVVWQPVDVGSRAARRKGRGLIGHVAVSSSKNLVPGPLSSRTADWHLYLPKFGPAIQYIDLDVQCWASGAGNASLVAFESEGGLGTTAQVNAEPWTDNQLDWAARILRHLHDTESVPLWVMENSLPSERGFGTHRLGIDPWRVPGGEVWSSARGKLCPGDAKHAQRSEVVRRAGLADISSEDDMDVNQAGQLQTVHDLLKVYLGPSIARQEERQLQFRTEALAQIAGLQTALAELAKNSSLSAAELQAAVEAGTAKAIKDNVITIDVAPGVHTS